MKKSKGIPNSRKLQKNEKSLNVEVKLQDQKVEESIYKIYDSIFRKLGKGQERRSALIAAKLYGQAVLNEYIKRTSMANVTGKA